jgi:hypothetical protein
VLEREGSVNIDLSDCYYIDREGIRWLAAAKAAQQVNFSDRRREDRRERARAAAGADKRASGQRRDRPDRRKRSEF